MPRNFIKEYLDAGHTKGDLSENFGIHRQECDGLTVYKYDQIESPKAEQIVRQARGVILDDESNEIVHYPFYRFFNYGEIVEEEKRFNWSNAVVTEKVDGSLMGIFYHRGEWRLCTSSQIGGMNQTSRSPYCYRELVEMATRPLTLETFYQRLNPRFDYIFELVSPFNTIVTPYAETRLYLLGARDKEDDFREIPFQTAYDDDEIISSDLKDAAILRIPKVKKALDSSGNFLGLNEIVAMANRLDQTDEGFVVVDYSSYDLETGSFPRLKVKNASYLALKYLHSSEIERSVSFEEILSVVYQSEEDEFLAVLPQYQSLVATVKTKWLAYVEEFRSVINDSEIKPFFDVPLSERDNRRGTFVKAVQTRIDDKFDHNLLFMTFKSGKTPRQVLDDMIATRGRDYVFKILWRRVSRIS